MYNKELTRPLKLCPLVFLIIFGAWTQYASQPLESCKNFTPSGMPSQKPGFIRICRQGYFAEVDLNAKIPRYVSYLLKPEHAIGCVKRTNAFKQDSDIPAGQGATPADYTHSGYDKGHISPDGDNEYNETVERESFLMSNMTPQLPGLNRGIWKILESDVRAWSLEMLDPMLVIAGPIYNTKTDSKIGNGVDVPTSFYKTVIDMKKKRSVSFIMPNREGLGKDLKPFVTNIHRIEDASGIRFGISGVVEDYRLWGVSTGLYSRAKKIHCFGG
jgi:endonuclease G